MPSDPTIAITETKSSSETIEEAPEGISLVTDPLSAAFATATALLNFFCSVQGQRIVAGMLTLDAEFVKKLDELFTKVHSVLTK